MKILKFGSASIATANRIKDVLNIASKERGNIIVLSSIAGTAEALHEVSNYLYKKNNEGAIEIINKLELDYIQLTSDLFKTESLRQEAVNKITTTFDYIRTFSRNLFTLFEERIVLAQGELLLSDIFLLMLSERNIKAALLPALEFMRTDKNAEPDAIFLKEKLSELLDSNKDTEIFITQGYICKNAYGEIDDLRKGGNDLSASLIGAAVNAEEIQIWADVDVMLNNDSKYVEGTTAIKQMNFDEAAELTYFGSKILHPSSILPAKLANIPVRLLNTNTPDSQGTTISNKTEPHTVKAIAAREGITVIRVQSGRMLLAHGFLRRILEVFEDFQTPVDMLTTSEVGISVTIDNDSKLENIVDELKKYGTVSVDSDMAIVSVVGDLDWNKTGFGTQILDAVTEIPIRMVSYGGSNYNFSILIKAEDKTRTLQMMNQHFFGTK